MIETGLRDKVVIVTGAAAGIGKATARRFAQEGCQVASWDVKDGEAEAGGFFQTVDERLGTVDFLINNAGIGIYKPVLDLAPEEWHRMIDLNLSGVYYCSHEALQRMSGRGGYIINISSLAGKNAFAGGAGYNASKFGLNGFSEAMMMDHRYDGVRVSYVMPGSVAMGTCSRPS
jgi:NAD(P)-dependent dehydrogenase (short-subunit alcohol dehydrogenase family)